MANTTLSNPTNKIYFIAPYDDVKCNKYAHISLELPGNLSQLESLSEQEVQVITHLISDKKVKTIGYDLGFGYPEEQARQVVRRLRAKFNCETVHGLVAKLYQMGFNFTPLSESSATPDNSTPE